MLLLPEAILPHVRQELRSRFKFFHSQTLDSTNLQARREAERGGAEWSIYVSETQTAGRGREGRAWFSPPGGGIYCSVLFRPDSTPAESLVFTRFSALAIDAVLRRAVSPFGAELRVKPPNDLLLNGRKVCGILVESASIQHRTQFVVVGFGINVNQQAFPPEIAGTATSMRLECGRDFDRAELLGAVLTELHQWYETILRLGASEVDRHWRCLVP